MHEPSPLVSVGTARLHGAARIPGDKSISHRALILGALAVGETRVWGLLEGDDVMRTAAALRSLGTGIRQLEAGLWLVNGAGTGGLCEPGAVLDLGNSGTAVRLLMGAVATHPFNSVFTGDASLVRRPMQRVTDPLVRMGARFLTRSGGRLPLAVEGTNRPVPVIWEPSVPSAQVKSAVLLAGLNAPGETTVVEMRPTRDHTELMLRHFGGQVVVEPRKDGRACVTVIGQPELIGREIRVPGDPSSAAFVVVGAAVLPDSAVQLPGICLNPRRCGLYDTLTEMGADIRVVNQRVESGEMVGDLIVRGGDRLTGVVVPAERAPDMIDEYPVLAVAAAAAQGTTVMHGLKELRVKESDRLAMIASGLAANGVRVAIDGDTLTVHGTAGQGGIPGGASVITGMDHRIAMSFLVLGLIAKAPVVIDDGRFIDTSFPDFVAIMNDLGARITRWTAG